MDPLISVIVPVYNGQEHLKKCIESICGQTYQNLEIIIIDDGSTDDTAKLCNYLVDNYSTHKDNIQRIFSVIHIKHSGVSASRNTGIDRANGEYLAFVDADDRLMPDMLQLLFRNIVSSESDVSGCSFFKWTNEEEWNTSIQNPAILKDEYKVYAAGQFSECLIHGNSRCWSKIYKKSSLIESKVLFAEDLSIGEDMLFLSELTQYGFRFCESQNKCYGYYQNIEGAMSRKFSINAMDQIYCWERARGIIGAKDEIDCIIVISILLTVGRIAILEKTERDKYKHEIKKAHIILNKYYTRRVVSQLDFGYRIKTTVFRLMPYMYIFLYNIWKK